MLMHVLWLLALAAAHPVKKEAAWEKDWDQFEVKMKKQNDYFNKKLEALKTESPEMIKATQGMKENPWPDVRKIPSSFADLMSKQEDIQTLSNAQFKMAAEELQDNLLKAHPSSFLEAPKLDEDDFEGEELREEKAVERPLWAAQAKLKRELKQVDKDLEKRGVEPESFLETEPRRKHFTPRMLAQLKEHLLAQAASFEHAAGPSSLIEERSVPSLVLPESLMQQLPKDMQKAVQSMKVSTPAGWVEAAGYPQDPTEREAYEDLDKTLGLYTQMNAAQKQRQDSASEMIKEMRAENQKELTAAKVEQKQWERHHTLPEFASSLLEEGEPDMANPPYAGPPTVPPSSEEVSEHDYTGQPTVTPNSAEVEMMGEGQDMQLEDRHPAMPAPPSSLLQEGAPGELNLDGAQPHIDAEKSRKLQELLGKLQVSQPDSWEDAEGFPKDPAKRDAFEDLDSSVKLYRQLKGMVTDHFKKTQSELENLKADASKQVKDAQLQRDEWEHTHNVAEATPPPPLPAPPSSLLETELPAELAALAPLEDSLADPVLPAGPSSFLQESPGYFDAATLAAKKKLEADEEKLRREQEVFAAVAAGKGQAGDAAKLSAAPPKPLSLVSEGEADPSEPDEAYEDGDADEAAEDAQADGGGGYDSDPGESLGFGPQGPPTMPSIGEPSPKPADGGLASTVLDVIPKVADLQNAEVGAAIAESKMPKASDWEPKKEQGSDENSDDPDEAAEAAMNKWREDHAHEGGDSDDDDDDASPGLSEDAQERVDEGEGETVEDKAVSEGLAQESRVHDVLENSESRLHAAVGDSLLEKSAKKSGKRLSGLLAKLHADASSFAETAPGYAADKAAAGDAKAKLDRALAKLRREASAHMKAGSLLETAAHDIVEAQSVKQAQLSQAESFKAAVQQANSFRGSLTNDIKARLAGTAVGMEPSSLLQTGERPHGVDLLLREAADTIRRGHRKADRLGKHLDAEIEKMSLLQRAEVDSASDEQSQAMAMAEEHALAETLARSYAALTAHKQAEGEQEQNLDASLAHLIRTDAEDGTAEQRKKVAAQLFMKTLLSMTKSDPATDPQDWKRLISMLQDDASQFRAASLLEKKQADTPSDTEPETDYAAKYRDAISEPLGQLKQIANRYKHESDNTKKWLHDETSKILANDDAAPSSLLEGGKPHFKFERDAEEDSLEDRQKDRELDRRAKEAIEAIKAKDELIKEDEATLEADVKHKIPFKYPDFDPKPREGHRYVSEADLPAEASSLLQAREEPIDRAQHKLEALHEKFAAEAEHYKSMAAKDEAALPESLLQKGPKFGGGLRMGDVHAYAMRMADLHRQFARDAAHIREVATQNGLLEESAGYRSLRAGVKAASLLQEDDEDEDEANDEDPDDPAEGRLAAEELRRTKNPFKEPLVLPKLDFSKLEAARKTIGAIEADAKKSGEEFKAETAREHGQAMAREPTPPLESLAAEIPSSLLETGSADPLAQFHAALAKIQAGMDPANREFQAAELAKVEVPLEPDDPDVGKASQELKMPAPPKPTPNGVPYMKDTPNGPEAVDAPPVPSSFLQTGNPSLAQVAREAEALQKHMAQQQEEYRDNAERIREKSGGPSMSSGGPGAQLDSLLQRVHETTSAFKAATAEESQRGAAPSSLAELRDHPKLEEVEKKFKAFAEKMATEATAAEKGARDAQDRLATASNALLPSSFVEEGERMGAWEAADAKHQRVQALIQRQAGEIQQWQQTHSWDTDTQAHFRQVQMQMAQHDKERQAKVAQTASQWEYDTAKWRQHMEEKESNFKNSIGANLAKFEQAMQAPMRQLPSSFAEIHAEEQANSTFPHFRHHTSLAEQKFADDLAAFRTHVEEADGGHVSDPADYISEPTFAPLSAIPPDGVLTDDPHTFEGASSLGGISYLQRKEQLRSESK